MLTKYMCIHFQNIGAISIDLGPAKLKSSYHLFDVVNVLRTNTLTYLPLLPEGSRGTLSHLHSRKLPSGPLRPSEKLPAGGDPAYTKHSGSRKGYQ